MSSVLPPVLPTNQSDATRLGTKTYRTGLPCKRGHYSERWTRNGVCRQCLVEYKMQHPPRRVDEATPVTYPVAMNSLPVSQSEAARLGRPQYRTGKPCKHGHIANRWTLNGTCCQCLNSSAARRRNAYRAALEAARKNSGES